MNWYDISFDGRSNVVTHVTKLKVTGNYKQSDDGKVTIGSSTLSRAVLICADSEEEAVCKAVDIVNKLNHKSRKPKKKKTNWR